MTILCPRCRRAPRFDLVESRDLRGRVSWAVRVLTKDGRARELPLLIDGAHHVRYVGARLNAALAVASEPTGYRDDAQRFRAPALGGAAEREDDAASESRLGARAR